MINFNNLRLTFRTIAGNRGISLINITGLALGLMAVILIFQYINFERSYDSFFQDNDRIYRLVFYRHYKTGLDKSVGNNYYVGQLAAQKVPGIKNFCRCKMEPVFIKAGDQIFREERTLFADSSFFDIFSHQVLSGVKRDFMRSPGEAVITKSLALKYFGTIDVAGKSVLAGNKTLKISGVIQDLPRNTHLKFDLVISLASITDKNYCYSCNNTNTYFLLEKGSDPAKLEELITTVGKNEFISRGVETDYPIEYKLQRLTDIHLHSNYRFEFEANGNSSYLTLLLVIAFLILMSAGLNYYNLYSSIVHKRFHGIGIRRAAGASENDIIRELISESLVTGLLSLLVSFAFLFFLFPLLKKLLDLDFNLTSAFYPGTWLIPLLILIAMSILTGIFLGSSLGGKMPAYFLGKQDMPVSKKLSRRFLIVVQYSIAVALICITIIALKQISFMKREALTMEIDNTLVVRRPASSEYNKAQNSFQESFLKIPGVTGYTFSTICPGEKNTWVKGGICLKGEEKLMYQFYQMDVSPGFFDFFKINLVEGRQFFKDENNWTGGPRHLILNREAAMVFGKADPKELIGKTMYDSDMKQDIGEIVGIVDGYFQNSLDQEVRPVIFNCDQGGYYIYIKISEQNREGILDKVLNEYKLNFPDQYLEYYFLDDFFNSQYRSHIQLFRSIMIFCIMAIIITSLSLLGLVLTEISGRIKEIGIRKLNGASLGCILYILNLEYIILVLISFIMAFPAALYIGSKWLENFAYRIDPGWWIFALSAVIAILIALLTVNWQSWKAATSNPVDALKYE